MIRITGIELPAKDLRHIGKNNIIDIVGNSIDVDGTKFWLNFWTKWSNSKNRIRSSLAKF